MDMESIAFISVTSNNTAKSLRGGSRPGKRGNIDIGRHRAAKKMDMDNFARDIPGPTLFSEAEFKRRYRMRSIVSQDLR